MSAWTPTVGELVTGVGVYSARPRTGRYVRAYDSDESVIADETGYERVVETASLHPCMTRPSGSSTTEWAVLNGDNLEAWPTREAAAEEMRHFYSEDARLVSRTVTEWTDVDGNS